MVTRCAFCAAARAGRRFVGMGRREMKNLTELMQTLDQISDTPPSVKIRTKIRAVLRAIVKACREKDMPELERQAQALLALCYDPANLFLGITPEPASAPPELYNEIKNKTMAVLEKIASDKDEKD
jgi:hypothetical protein